MGTSIPAAGGGGQDPANVAITGGSIAGVTRDGYTATQFKNAMSRAVSDWDVTAWTAMKAGAPSITAFKEIPILVVPLGTSTAAVAGDPGVEGGGITTNGTTAYLSGGIFQNVSAGSVAFTVRLSGAALSSGKNIQAGVSNVSGGGGTGHEYILIGAVFSVDAANFVCQMSNANGAGGAGTVTVTLGAFDASIHDWTYADDGTTITIYKDGVSAGTTATRTGLPSALNMQPYFFSDATGSGILRRFGYGYVA